MQDRHEPTDRNEPARLKPYQGLAVFILVILSSILIAAPIQRRWGIYGLALTELMILLLAVIPVILLKADPRTVFPAKKPSLRQTFGVFVLWSGSYVAVILVTLVIAYFFSEGLLKVSGRIQDTFTSVPIGIAFLIVAVMPAICEEALHRGLILSSLRPIGSKWTVVLIMGIIFGVFHLDPYRFVPTAFLGMVITYIMVETRNIVLPMLFHFINNGLTTFVAFANRSQPMPTELDRPMLLMGIATYLLIGSIFPFLLLWGSGLIREKGSMHNPDPDAVQRRKRMISLAMSCSALMVLAGLVIMALNIGKLPVFGSQGFLPNSMR